MWVRTRYPLQTGETSVIWRLAHWAEREEAALKDLMSEIELARSAARGLPAIPDDHRDSAQTVVAKDQDDEDAAAYIERKWGIG
jgi:hypothetical protein